ncbi:hypothetical protein ISG29_11055 [Nocardioides sp. CBS4Y-1]|uniref:Alpha/beta hydrolase domain-containing protein n=1 Tax=Nocardioides acrostichi TaxID=2784339 RepID=A0A930UWN1_9ACTN|nr:alpha/beta hydrolase domain-containing protein [Nocardioides acrostichi]MBF4162228.1 hypothetical protein [Nocardioides acrostichi]
MDLAAIGWTETEYLASGTAVSVSGAEAPYCVRVVLRRPPQTAASGTAVVEWLNVSSGREAAPEWTYVSAEIVRRGHVYAAVSAQYVGVEGGTGSVTVGEGLGAPGGLKGEDPERYGSMSHPGDAWCFDIYSQIAVAVGGLVDAELLLAAGESQSACTLSRYLASVHVQHRVFHGFLVHSRGGALPPSEPAAEQYTMAEILASNVGRLPDDLDARVVVVQTETDVLGRMNSFPARQPDGPSLRTWEVAGTAHADLFQIGEFEEFLGCPTPVNRGQQVFVLRAALRALEEWVRDDQAPPSAQELEVRCGAYVLDEVGNTRGGVRTPAVDVPVEMLSGFSTPEATIICQLFGSTTALDSATVAGLYSSREEYLTQYENAARAMVGAGFALAEDLDELFADAVVRADQVDA